MRSPPAALIPLLAVAGLVINALNYGLIWWPLRYLQGWGLHPMWATVMVDTLACAGIFALFPRIWRAFLAHRWLWLLALAAGGTNVGFSWGVVIGDVVRVTLLTYLMPAWVVLLAWPILGEKPNAGAVARLALALGGMVVVLKTPDSPWPVPESFADALGLLGGLSFAMVNIMLRKLRHAPPVANALAMFGGGGLGCLVAALVGMHFGMVQVVPPLETPWVVGVLLLTVAIIIANSTLQYGASRLPANTTSIIMLLEVVFASVSSVWLGAGVLTSNTLIGGALIFAACVWSALTSTPQPAPDAAPVASQ